MHRAPDLLTRWPALDVPQRRTGLHDTVELSAGRLNEVLRSVTPAADAAWTGLWNSDPSTWSGDVSVQQKIANRLGWLASPGLMADNLARIRSFADGVK